MSWLVHSTPAAAPRVPRLPHSTPAAAPRVPRLPHSAPAAAPRVPRLPHSTPAAAPRVPRLVVSTPAAAPRVPRLVVSKGGEGGGNMLSLRILENRSNTKSFFLLCSPEKISGGKMSLISVMAFD